MKGIILAGGSGTRLHPLTIPISKQLLPVYDKPMIYYPLSTLMLAGIKEVLIITTPEDKPRFQRLLGFGHELGMTLAYASQPVPRGLAEAFLIGEKFLAGEDACLVLGDNIFHGAGLSILLQTTRQELSGCTLFGYRVDSPERYGVAQFENDRVVKIIEKPAVPPSKVAITGLYFYGNDVCDIAKTLKPSSRGELEITDLNNVYIDQGRCSLKMLQRGTVWLDTGTPQSLLDASQFVQVLETRQGSQIACLEEIAYRMKYITAEQLGALASRRTESQGSYLRSVLEE